MRLFIAEKPSLARTIAEGLGRGQNRGGYLDLGQDVVTWCFGHLLDLAQPEHYHEAWGNRFDRSILPIVPEQVVLVPRDDQGIKQQLALIKQLLGRCSLVVNAGDPDREGQLLVDEVLEYLNYRGPSQRIFLAALDPRSVAKALANLEDNKRYAPWRDAAATRRLVDWLGGINLSRAMTIFGHSIGLAGVLSLGRVQTPTLRIVVDRDRQIANFVPVDYAQLVAQIEHAAGNFKATFKPGEDQLGLDPEGRLIDFKVAEEIQRSSANLPGIIENCERKNGKEWAKLPYSLASLQVEAGAKHNLGAQQVLNIAQHLYESKLITYPRTDCEYLPEEQFQDAPLLLTKLQKISSLAAAAKGAKPSLKSKAWNTKKITAHHAIIPTGELPVNLSYEEQAVYHLVALRYILQFWPPLEYQSTKLTVVLANQTVWEATGKIILKPGWSLIVKPDKEEEEPLPMVQKGDAVRSGAIELLKKRTTPPPHFTEGTLIKAMKNIHRFVEDKSAQAKLRETSGLGTEATRAGILEILKQRGYLTSKGKSLLATEKGQHVIDLCPETMKDIVTTAVLEDILSDVQKGSVPAKQAVATYVTELAPMINALFAQDRSKMPKLKYEHCPLCDLALQRVQSKKNKSYFWICQNPDCAAFFEDLKGKVGKQIIKPEISQEHKCPNCGQALARRARKDGSGFFWSCTGYPACKWSAPDQDGKPGTPRPKAEPPVAGKFKCPLCGHELSYGISQKTGRPYWACFVKSPKHGRKAKFFNLDAKGAPVLEEDPEAKGRKQVEAPVQGEFLCPDCGKPLRYGIAKTGRPYWACFNLAQHGGQARFFNPDAKGAPILEQAAAKSSVGRAKTQAAPGDFCCPDCGMPLRHGVAQTGRPYWACFNLAQHGGQAKFFALDPKGAPKFN